MEDIPKLLIGIGITFILIGILWYGGSKYLNLGTLPGDITIEKEKFKFYFPLTTSIILSILLTLILWVIFAVLKK